MLLLVVTEGVRRCLVTGRSRRFRRQLTGGFGTPHDASLHHPSSLNSLPACVLSPIGVFIGYVICNVKHSIESGRLSSADSGFRASGIPAGNQLLRSACVSVLALPGNQTTRSRGRVWGSKVSVEERCDRVAATGIPARGDRACCTAHKRSSISNGFDTMLTPGWSHHPANARRSAWAVEQRISGVLAK